MNKLTQPAWPNHCGHADRGYVGSFRLDSGAYDVFLHDQQGTVGVCIRFGADHPDYSSWPTLELFYMGASSNTGPVSESMVAAAQLVNDWIVTKL